MLFLKYPIPEFFWMGRVLSPRQQSVRYVFCIFFHLSPLYFTFYTHLCTHASTYTYQGTSRFLSIHIHIHIQRVVNSYVEINLVVYDSR